MIRTIPDDAWGHVGRAVFRDGHLYPDTVQPDGSYPDSTDVRGIEALAHFTRENYAEWAGATILCPRAPALEQCMFRFDDVGRFIAHGYTNPHREPGVPDWYFFWTKVHTVGTLKRFARQHGLLPSKDLPQGRGGYGADNGLRALG
jgi:hypothetical protein